MFKKLFGIPLIIVSIFSGACNASNTYMMDFSTPAKYVSSLNNIRKDLGRPLSNIGNSQAQIFELSPQAVGSRDGIIVAVRGIDYHGDDEITPVSFVLDPTNLYVAGFIANNIYHRFSDTAEINAPGVSSTIQMNQESSYTALQRVANMPRNGMAINRAVLSDGYAQLARFSESSLNQETARAMLRYITVIPEALRFRQIQRNFRPSLDLGGEGYVMGDSDIGLTLNWSGISSTLNSVDEIESPGIRVGAIDLPNATAILATIAISLNCNANYRTAGECSVNDSVIIDKVVWNKKEIAAFL
ncbi:ribosome-inactivating family protein [Serratia sp. CY81684]|uniref:ribosome-inactivating family protein n=1 Tax=Serratia sp. CY81684 TaxID=3383686 RepID=UPI003F9ECB97